MPQPLLRTFSQHYREKFGHPVGKIPLHLGETCPNRAQGGCIFCSAPAFSPGYLKEKDTLSAQLEDGKKKLLKGRFIRYFAYFQQETPTAAPKEKLIPEVATILKDEDCEGLIIATRPDSIAWEFAAELADLVRYHQKDCLFEIGLQSIHEKSLLLLNRNHSYADFCNTYQKLREFPEFEVGVHLILGIPHESQDDMRTTLESLAKLGIDAVKLHHLQVIAATPLHEMYKQGKIDTLDVDQYLDLLVTLIPLIPERVVIHRLWATAHPQMLIAPRWNILATHLSSRFNKLLKEADAYQGKYCQP